MTQTNQATIPEDVIEAADEAMARFAEIVMEDHPLAAQARAGKFRKNKSHWVARFAILAERERCAQIADDWLGIDFDESANVMAANIAADIRTKAGD